MTTKMIQIDPQPVEYAPDAFSYKDDWYMCADDMADRLVDEYDQERPDSVLAKRINGVWVIEVTP